MRYDRVIANRIERMRAERSGEAPPQSVPTGLRALDKRGGIARGVLTLVGANTGEGKDMFVLNVVKGAALAGCSAEVLSMEDPPDRTADRTLADETGINSARLSTPDKLTDDEFDRTELVPESTAWAERVEWHTGLVTPEAAIEIVENSTADLRVVNYLQAFPANDGSLERIIADFCWKLNEVAQKSNAAVLAVSQANVSKVEERGLRLLERSTQRDPTKPNVEGFAPWGASDLAWCTAAGQRAKDLLMLFRPGRYLRRAGFPSDDNRLEIRRVKSNFRAEGRMVVGFDRTTARLYDLDEKEKEPNGE